MGIGKITRAVIFICQIIVLFIMVLNYAPWWGMQPDITGYYLLIAIFYVLWVANVVWVQLRKKWQVKYKSYLDNNSGLKKKLILPGAQEIKDALAVCFTTPRHIVGGFLFALLFYVNYLMIYSPGTLQRLPILLFGYDAQTGIATNNVWLAICSLCVLLLCAVIISQNRHIIVSNKLANRQNLIVNAHSSIALNTLRVIFTDINRMFLNANKLEYILNAKPVVGLRQQSGQALLNLRINIKLNNDYSITEFYIRQLSLFVGDTMVECDNYHTKFFQVFALDHDFVLSFYLKFTDTDPRRLQQIFEESGRLKLYYSLMVKNSFSVITDIYGSAVYQKSAEDGADNEEGFYYLPESTKDNQYFYM